MNKDFLMRLRSIWHPEMYHGFGYRQGYFQGWYFKIVDASQDHAFAVVPGIFLGYRGQHSHAFVQVLEGKSGCSWYQSYPLESFQASTDDRFHVQIGPNHFTMTSLSLDLDLDGKAVRGKVHFQEIKPWPVHPFSPGIMGPFAFIPFMECYHGVLSLDHSIGGTLHWGEESIDFHGGRGYTETDYGQAFPRAWVWMQSNHFSTPGASLTISVARIPWLGVSFRGFIMGLWHEGRLHQFTTYLGSRLGNIRITDEEVRILVESRQEGLRVRAFRSGGGLLHAPYRVEMECRVSESFDRPG